MNVYVIVPEGISLNDNNQIIPSFVFRQVLEYLSNILQKDSKVYFAPANNFNTKYFELSGNSIFSYCKFPLK